MPDPRRRLQAVLLAALFILSLIAGRLIQLQGLERTTYSTMAEKQRLRTVALTAPRGSIVDRDGNPLAETVDARDVYADPHEVALAVQKSGPAHQVSVTSIAAAVAPLLGADPATVAAKLSGPGSFVYLARAVAPEVADKVLALEEPGIGALATTKRVYPAGDLASNIVGLVGLDGTGLAGLEYSKQTILAGHEGKRTFETGLAGSPIPDGRDILTPAVPGTGLRLTLQRDIQWEAQQALTKQVKATGASSGTVVVMNPRTGQVLALAVAPGFDPAHPERGHLGDAAATDVYEPGSVSKVITMSAALQERLVTPLTPVTVPPSYRYHGTTFHDAEGHGTEHLTVAGVLAKSSNIGTIQIAEKLGPQRLYDFMRAYGFGSPTGVGLPGEGSGLLPPPNLWSGTTLPTVSFGQGVGVTALQVATVYATVANGGVRVQPTLVAGSTDPQGHYHASPAPTTRRVIDASVAGQVRDMLEAVTTDQGTAPKARIPGYRIAGKTGTAQRPNGHGYSGYTATFVGFAPADNPQLLVEVVLQQPVHGHFGGEVAAPVFHDVMAFALQTLKIAPTGTKPPTVRLTVGG